MKNISNINFLTIFYRLENKPNSAPVNPLARFHYQLSNSPRGQRKRLLIRNSSSHTLNIPNSSPSVNRKHTSDTTDNTANKSAQNSPSNIRRHDLKQDLKPRPRSLSDDRMNNDHHHTTVAIFVSFCVIILYG